ncbi:ACR family protein, partial [Paenibacillus dendritiformis]
MTRIRALTALLLACASVLAAACASDGRWVELGGERHAVEIASTDEARARGLMFRSELEQGTGMLFIHEREEPQAYWMKNTHIPLDILYFGADRSLVSQQRDVPPCSSGVGCPAYPSRGPALYVLE